VKSKLLGVIAITLAFGVIVQARIGETEAQIALRYGEAGVRLVIDQDDLGNVQRGYNFHDLTVVVAFQNGSTVCESSLSKRMRRVAMKFRLTKLTQF
jgi:hypothetical protein